MNRPYHYEYAAYTDNLCWGRMKLWQSTSKTECAMQAARANKGCYIIRKIRVYEK